MDEKLEEELFLAFKHKYEVINPQVEKPGTLSVKNVGFQFWLYMSTSLAAVILAAMRTVDAFYKMSFASSGSWAFSFFEASMAIFAIEGGLVVYAADRAIKENSGKVKISGGKARLGTVLMLLISTIAGTNQALTIVQGLPQTVIYWMQIALTLSVGIGASFIAYIGGEVIGQQIVIMTNGYEDRIKKYEEDVRRYNESLKASWRVSPEKKGLTIPQYKAEPRPHAGGREPIHKNAIFAYMDEIWANDRRVASWKECMEKTGAGKATTSDVRNLWIANHPEASTPVEVVVPPIELEQPGSFEGK